MKVSPAQRIAIERRVGLEGKLHDFVGMCFAHVEPGSEFVDNWHLEEVCAHLEAMYRGEIDQLGICIPPGCIPPCTGISGGAVNENAGFARISLSLCMCARAVLS